MCQFWYVEAVARRVGEAIHNMDRNKGSLASQSSQEVVGDKFGESLGGSQAPPSFWKVPRLPQKFPGLPRKFLSDFPGSSVTVELNSNPEVPRKFPRLSRNFPELPQNFPELPQRSAPFSGKPDTLSPFLRRPLFHKIPGTTEMSLSNQQMK